MPKIEEINIELLPHPPYSLPILGMQPKDSARQMLDH